jgi:general secretion pathway protein M
MSDATMTSSTMLPTLRQQARGWWLARTARERQLVSLVVIVIAAFAVWILLVQPALRTVREAPAQLERLDDQYQQMQRVATESASLRGAARVSPGQAAAALKAATDRLGEHARLVMQGDRASLTLTGVSPEALRAWLNEARSGARARPIDAQLQRSPQGYGGTLGVSLGGAP